MAAGVARADVGGGDRHRRARRDRRGVPRTAGPTAGRPLPARRSASAARRSSTGPRPASTSRWEIASPTRVRRSAWYLHVTAAGAAPLVAALRERAQRGGDPVRAEGRGPTRAASRAATPRCCTSSGAASAAPADRSRALAAACAPHLRPRACRRSRRPWAAGIAVAEHQPELGASFGTSRCLIVAGALVRSARAGRRRARRAPGGGGAPVRRPRPRRRPPVPRGGLHRTLCALTASCSSASRPTSRTGSPARRSGRTGAATGWAPSRERAVPRGRARRR